MKRKPFLPLLLFVAALVALTSCGSKSGKTGLLVPEDAAIVFHINNSSLASKLSWDEIKQTNWFKAASGHSKDSFAQKLLQDPSASGIDTKADFVVFLKKATKNGYLVFEGSIKDATAFENFNKQMHNSATTVKEGDISSIALDDDAALTWDKNHFAYVMGISIPRMNMGGDMGEYGSNEKTSTDSLKLYGKSVLGLKKSALLDNDSRFVDLIKDGKDMHMWINSDETYENMFPMMEMAGNIAALVKGNVGALSFNFDNGKITMDSKSYYGKELSSILSKYKASAVSADVAGRIPSQNVILALAMNYPPEAIKEIIKVAGMEGFANMALLKAGISLDELIKATKGEFLFSVSDIQMKEKADTIDMGGGKPFIHSRTEPDAKVLFAASVNDKAAFEKMVTLLWDKMKEEAPAGSTPPVTYKVENNWFALSNHGEHVDQFLAGNSPKSPIADRISGHPIGFFLDVRQILQTIRTIAKDSAAQSIFGLSTETWENIAAWGGEYSGNSMEFHAEINMMDKKTNSLKQLNTYIDKIATTFINKEKERSADIEPVAPF